MGTIFYSTLVHFVVGRRLAIKCQGEDIYSGCKGRIHIPGLRDVTEIEYYPEIGIKMLRHGCSRIEDMEPKDVVLIDRWLRRLLRWKRRSRH